jgi:hypothetical protein
MSGSRRHECLCLGSGGRGARVECRIKQRERNRGGGRRAGGSVREVGNEGAVHFLGIGAGLEITRGRVVGLHGLA